MPYGNKMPKKMGCSGGGPNMYKMGSQERNSPMNFSDKAMMYMKKMPAMYGKPTKFKDQKGTSEGITKADVVSARTKGYNPKMYGKKK